MAAIRCTGVSVHRGGRQAVVDIDLVVPAGRIVGLLGPSGSGKTTLMRAIVGTQRGVRGRIEVLGRPAGSAALRERIGYVTQAASVYRDLTVTANVAYFARLYGTVDRVDEVIDALDLRSAAGRRGDQLSGGQLNRVSIACALVGSPELLILDEPTVGLDPVLRADLWRRLRGLADDGVTLLISSHVMAEADHCDSLLLLRDGRLLADLTPDELRRRTGRKDLESAFLALIEEAE